MITGIDRPTSGEVIIGGVAVHTLSEGQIAVWRGSTVGVVFQFFQLLPTLTVVENVMLPMDFCNTLTRPAGASAPCFCSARWKWGARRQAAHGTSGGQQQRIAIARALANDPPSLSPTSPRATSTRNGRCRIPPLRAARRLRQDHSHGYP